MTNETMFKTIRESMSDYFNGIKRTFPMGDPDKRGVFVTLHLQGKLRGCIGCLEGQMPLEETLYSYARKAALEDPRFPPVTQDQWRDCQIEITLLSPFERVKDLDEISIGTHGLFLRSGYRSGLFLPQVPVEQKWDLTQYLENLCYKAGLPGESWKTGELFKFTGEIFHE